ncbi:MAG: calcium-binding protein [bacterium]|jgi:Ca2+-binding RTX toxin-like protein|nr:hypothetical protein [Betaproteobacteria bacterium]
MQGGDSTGVSFSSSQVVQVWPTGLTLTLTGSFVYNGVPSDATLDRNASVIGGIVFALGNAQVLVRMDDFPPLTDNQLDQLTDPQFIQFYVLDALEMIGSAFANGVYIVFGDLGADSILGGNGNNVLMGERRGASATGGNDTIRGEGGDDLIDGDAGNDVILGDNGFDVIEGGAGADIMGGSAASLAGPETTSNDYFIYRAMSDAGDSIYGFDIRAANSNTIDLLSLFTTLVTLIDRNAVDITDAYFAFTI